MTLEDIYFECEQKGITVDYFKTDKAKAFSFPYENGIVVLDKSKIETTAEETVLLAHEEVHIDLGAFYLFTTPLTVKGKMEQKVKELFSKIPAVENPTPRPFYEIPEHDEMYYCLLYTSPSPRD